MVQSRKKKTGSKAQSENQPIASSHATAPIPTADDTFEQVVKEVQDYAIILLDQRGTILTWNTGAEKIKGYTNKEIVGKNYRIFYTAQDKEARLSDKLLELAKEQGRANYEGWRVRKDGTRFWANMTLTALHNEDGSMRGFVKVTRDLTEKKRAEDIYSNFVEELRLKNEELKQSEERYHKMISEVRDYAIILLDKEGKILDWNNGAEKLKGYTSTEILGKSFRLFYPKEEKESGLPDRLLAEAERNGSVTHEGWRIRKDGTRFWGYITITALHDENGGTIGFSKLTRDLTHKKIAEDRVSNAMEELRQLNEQLRESEERYHGMIAEVQDYAILLLNKHGEVQSWNAGAQLIKGYSGEEVIGKHFRLFYPEEDRKSRLPETLLKIASDKGKASHEGWRVRKDGSRFWGSVVITALHNVQGNIIGYSKVTRDLTERKIADDALKASAAQLDLKNKTLERLNEELSSFSHVASHDMKEPLRKIHAFAARIESEGFDPEKTRDYVHKIIASTKGLQRLIDDLLSYSQVSNQNSGFERVDLNAVVTAVRGDLEFSINEKKAIIKVGKLPIVNGIAFQLQQLFLNLISNAIKFSRPGEPPSITIRCKIIRGPEIPGVLPNGDNKYYHISVRDEGIGFSQEYSDRIFEAFERLHSKNKFPGTGIGLAIVKKIVENHQGIISAEGQPDGGATFHLYLPV